MSELDEKHEQEQEENKNENSSEELEQMIQNRKAETEAFKKILRSLEEKVQKKSTNKNNKNEK